MALRSFCTEENGMWKDTELGMHNMGIQISRREAWKNKDQITDCPECQAKVLNFIQESLLNKSMT